MLSRTADHLYWMARYVERAENLARMIEVNFQSSLLPQPAADLERLWASTLATIGSLEAYTARHGSLVPDKVVAFLMYDADHQHSIVSCIAAARENGRAVRGALTAELWQTLNATWLEMRQRVARRSAGEGLVEFCEWIKQRSHLIGGVTISTMLRDQGFHFLRLGTFLERADSTARILDVQFRVLAGSDQESTGNDFYRYSMLLQSVSAFEIYRRTYRDQITPRRVAELLLLNADMPRSLHRCMDEVCLHLEHVANSQSAETLRQAGELRARLHFGRIDDVLKVGLHESLEDCLARFRELGNGIARDFLVPAES